MKCQCCNIELNDFEACRKDLKGVYMDFCNDCYTSIKLDVLTLEREDLRGVDNLSNEDLEND